MSVHRNEPETRRDEAAGDAVAAYQAACQREQVDCLPQLLDLLSPPQPLAAASRPPRSHPTALRDADLICLAAGLRALPASGALRALHLDGGAFALPGLRALLAALEANPGRIRELRLGRNRLADDAAIALTRSLARGGGCGVKVLDLSENALTADGAGALLVGCFAAPTSLVEVSLHRNRLDARAGAALARAIASSSAPKHLHLGGNALGDEGGVALARALPHAATLATLDLSGNGIGGDGGRALAVALLQPTVSLQRLHLRQNPLDDDARRRFVEVIATNRSLVQLLLGFTGEEASGGEGEVRRAGSDKRGEGKEKKGGSSAALTTAALRALRGNPTLRLLDLRGWSIDAGAAELLTGLREDPPASLAAVVVDVVLPPGGGGRVYVGPDDVAAMTAVAAATRAEKEKEKSRRGGGRCASSMGRRSVSRDPSRRRHRDGGSERERNGTREADRDREREEKDREREGREGRARSARRGESRSGSVRRGGGGEHRAAPLVEPSLVEVIAGLRAELTEQRERHNVAIHALDARITALERDRGRRDDNSFFHPLPARKIEKDDVEEKGDEGEREEREGSAMRAAPSVSIDRSYRQTPPQPHRSQALSETMETPRSTAMLMRSTTNSLIRGIHYQPHNASLTSHMSVGEMREVSPGETSLQRSVNVQNFPPRIEPSPSQDPNPPRRKSLMQAITN